MEDNVTVVLTEAPLKLSSASMKSPNAFSTIVDLRPFRTRLGSVPFLLLYRARFELDSKPIPFRMLADSKGGEERPQSRGWKHRELVAEPLLDGGLSFVTVNVEIAFSPLREEKKAAEGFEAGGGSGDDGYTEASARLWTGGGEQRWCARWNSPGRCTTSQSGLGPLNYCPGTEDDNRLELTYQPGQWLSQRVQPPSVITSL
ncbi:hypothetical protein KM043_011520 [Ampulex compressa]|nr:hypothetical protein KM043_011520 [Ampulex compressa]